MIDASQEPARNPLLKAGVEYASSISELVPSTLASAPPAFRAARMAPPRGCWRLPVSPAWLRLRQCADRVAFASNWRGETVYLTIAHRTAGDALFRRRAIEVTRADDRPLIVNNEEERFSGTKHTTEYPQASVDAMVATLRSMGRDIGDIAAWVTTWDYPTLFGTLVRSVLEEAPQGLKLLRNTEAAGFDGRRLEQMTRTPKLLGKQLGLPARVPLICMPHHDNHAWFSFAASPFADTGEPVAIAVLDGTGDRGSISLYAAENGAMRCLSCNDSVFDSLGAFYSVISSTQGGWTWLSSEGRYMGAAAWGDMSRATNPYYGRLKDVLDFGADGAIKLNRAMANWQCDPFDHPYKRALVEFSGEPLQNPISCGIRTRCYASRTSTTGRTQAIASTRQPQRNWCSRMP